MKHRLLFAATLMASLSASAAVEFTFTGSGTQADPYVLTTAAHISELAEKVNTAYGANTNFEYHCNGLYFVLGADIDMAGVTGFRGIGTRPADGANAPSTSYYFGGNIDGQGHTVANMTIDGNYYDPETGKATTPAKANTGTNYVGFVGTLGFTTTATGCTVKNIKFTNASVRSWNYAAIAVGNAYGNACRIENIVTDGQVEAWYSYGGGIVANTYGTGDNATTVTNCFNKASVKVGNTYAGGIVGYNKGHVTYCVNTGDVSVDGSFNTSTACTTLAYVGGISGYNPAATATACYNITGCVNVGSVYAAKQYAGGIAGRGYGANIEGCANYGRVTTVDGYAGGITGESQHLNNATVDYGYVRRCASFGQVFAGSNPGAIVGGTTIVTTTTARVENCYWDTQMADLTGVVSGMADYVTGCEGQPTAYWTAGTLPSSLTGFTAAEGRYPVPQTLCTADGAADAAVTAASLYFTLPEGTYPTDMHSAAVISTTVAGTTAALANGSGFYIADGKVCPPTVSGVYADTLTLSAAGVSRAFSLFYYPTLAEQFGGGSGTEADPYIIATVQHLQNLAFVVNEQGETLEGIFLRQTADLDLAGADFQGIASGAIGTKAYEKRSFSGHYDGGGHTISNLHIDLFALQASGAPAVTASQYCCVGLFGAINAGASVSSVTLKDAYVRGFCYVGGVVGYAYGAGNTYVSNCHVSGTVCSADTTGANYVGGVVGYVNSADTLCMDACSMQGTVNAFQYAGGIAAYGRVRVSCSVNSAAVTTSSPTYGYIGGITGYATGGSYVDCLNVGTLTGFKTLGGIAGQSSASATNQLVITRCLNIGRIMPRSTDTGVAGAVVGTRPSSTTYATIADNYYDAQLAGLSATSSGPLDGMTGLSTTVLTSGTAPEGFDADTWTFTSGLYPQLREVTTPDVAKAVATYFVIDGGKSVTNFSGSARISTAADVTATSANGSFTIADGVILATRVAEATADTITLMNDGWTMPFAVTNIPAQLQGSGTEYAPYLISSVDDYLAFVSMATDLGLNFEGEYLRVTADLDFADTVFRPVGPSTYLFLGNFDGAGHVIKNINYADSTAQIVAMFPCTGTGAVIRNITFSDCHIIGASNVAMVCARNNATLDSITVDATCSVEALTPDGWPLGTGAIVGANYGADITDCVNYASVTAVRYSGGIMGQEVNGGATLTRCANYGAIKATYPNQSGLPDNACTGGIVGMSTNLTYIDCENFGAVSAPSAGLIGGIAGYVQTGATFTGCANHGDVTAQGIYVGGIVGYTNAGSGTTVAFRRCYNDCSTVASTASGYVGGILGYAYKWPGTVTVDSCYNAATISGHALIDFGSTSCGGIIGFAANSGGITVNDSYNVGAVDCAMFGGGIVGVCNEYTNSVSVNRCFNYGTVTTASYYAAGIVGGGYSRVSSCYNVGAVSGTSAVSGIANMFSDTNPAVCSIADCYDTAVGVICAITHDNLVLTNCYHLGTGGVSADSLISAPLGDNYVYRALAFPMLKSLSDIDAAKAAAAYFAFSEGNSADNVSLPVTLCSSLDGIEWTASPTFDLKDGEAWSNVESGEGWLTVTCGDYSRTYTFTITGNSGIDAVGIDALDGTREYYTLQGVRVLDPQPGTIVIEVTRTPAGSGAAPSRPAARKVLIK